VYDKDRKSVLHLTEKDFALNDQDQVTSGFYFAAGTSRVSLLFALDESGSIRDLIIAQRQTAIELFNRFKNNSRVAALRFGQRAKLVADFDTEPDAVSTAFLFPPRRNERTAIFNAAQAAIDSFANLQKDVTERRIVILISDGLDNASTVKSDAVIRAAVEKQVSFYVIHLPLFSPLDGRLGIRRPAKGFRELAERTGGQYFLAADPKNPLLTQNRTDLTPVFNAIEEDLRSQFLIGFYLNERARDGRRHRVSVSLQPSGLVYSLAGRRFARTHHFDVDFRLRQGEP
jgi:Ca-activated chloride channel family protein